MPTKLGGGLAVNRQRGTPGAPSGAEVLPVREVRCGWCGRRFVAQRSTARYCSERCRNAHKYAARHGMRDGSFVESAPLPPTGMTRDDVCRVVVQLRGCAAALDGAAERGPRETRELCRRVSRGVLAALGEVGL